MSGDVVPSQRNLRMSNADREAVVARLNSAVADGRLTLVEFEERIDGVLKASAGATANIDGVNMSAGSAKNKVPSVPGSGPHLVVTGSAAAGSLVVRYERRFWRWRW